VCRWIQVIVLSGACYADRLMFHISNTDILKSIYNLFYLFSLHNKIWNNFFIVIHVTVKYLLYKRKLLVLWLLPHLEIHVEICLRD
jgi:hypothetical protein